MSTTTPQPAPVPGSAPATIDLVKSDLDARDAMGTQKYGVRHQHDNGRDHIIDAYQEVLDLAVYLRAEVEARKVLESRLAAAEERAGRMREALHNAEAAIQRRLEGGPYSPEGEAHLSAILAIVQPALLAALSPAPESAPNRLGEVLAKTGPWCERVEGCMCEPGHEGDCQVMAPGGKAETVAVKPAAPAAPEPAGALGEAIKAARSMLDSMKYDSPGNGYPGMKRLVDLLSRAADEQAALVKSNGDLAAECSSRAHGEAMLKEQIDALRAEVERLTAWGEAQILEGKNRYGAACEAASKAETERDAALSRAAQDRKEGPSNG